jgi:YidC/Oxa1 family membrane protein insertase
VWSSIREGALGALEAALTFLHDLVAFTEPHSWGWAIILLTLVIRVLLLPLAIKQTRSMRAMQALQPQIKELQKKHKVDRELMKKDPEQYKAKKQKLNEEMMALYQREGANPAASCLPLLAQAPIFLALFWMLRDQSQPGEPLFEAPFYFFTDFITGGPDDPTGLAATVSNAGWPGWMLIALMAGSMFWTMRQMNARTALTQNAEANPMAQQQKLLMYIMPVFLAVISFQFPLGILLYWVTTNLWQIAQQAIILREVKHEVETGTLADHPGGEAAARKGGGPKGGSKAGPKGGSKAGPKGGSRGGTKGGSKGGSKGGPKGGRAGGNGSGPPSGGPGNGKPKGSAKGATSGGGGRDGKNGRPTPEPEPTQGSDRPTPRPSKKRDHLPRRAGGERG